jgi:hypothetical protein
LRYYPNEYKDAKKNEKSFIIPFDKDDSNLDFILEEIELSFQFKVTEI